MLEGDLVLARSKAQCGATTTDYEGCCVPVQYVCYAMDRDRSLRVRAEVHEVFSMVRRHTTSSSRIHGNVCIGQQYAAQPLAAEALHGRWIMPHMPCQVDMTLEFKYGFAAPQLPVGTVVEQPGGEFAYGAPAPDAPGELLSSTSAAGRKFATATCRGGSVWTLQLIQCDAPGAPQARGSTMCHRRKQIATLTRLRALIDSSGWAHNVMVKQGTGTQCLRELWFQMCDAGVALIDPGSPVANRLCPARRPNSVLSCKGMCFEDAVQMALGP